MPIYVTQLRKEPEIPFLPDNFVDEPKLPPPTSYRKPPLPHRVISHNSEV